HLRISASPRLLPLRSSAPPSSLRPPRPSLPLGDPSPLSPPPTRRSLCWSLSPPVPSLAAASPCSRSSWFSKKISATYACLVLTLRSLDVVLESHLVKCCDRRVVVQGVYRW